MYLVIYGAELLQHINESLNKTSLCPAIGKGNEYLRL